MYGSGELEEKLGVKSADVAAPKITLTPKAAEALKAAIESDTEGVRFEIDAKFNYALSIGAKQPRDVAVDAGGVTLFLDRASAKRAAGTTVDYVHGPQGSAFKIDNPNEPPKVRQLSPKELAEKQRGGEKIALYDVRSVSERDTAKIEGAILLDRAGQDQILRLPKDTTLVFHCHHGGRSQQAADFFLSQGFKNVYNLAGGIDAWSVEVDPSVPRY
jgi:monothiol glutaredoxin